MRFRKQDHIAERSSRGFPWSENSAKDKLLGALRKPRSFIIGRRPGLNLSPKINRVEVVVTALTRIQMADDVCTLCPPCSG